MRKLLEYFNLWPSFIPPDPWKQLVQSMLHLIYRNKVPLLFTKSSNSWIALEDVIVMPEVGGRFDQLREVLLAVSRIHTL